MSSPQPHEFVVLGAGVAGLTTALELKSIYPNSKITVTAKHFPGSASMTEYTSPWAGANWHTFEKTYNQYAQYDKLAFTRFVKISKKSPESGVKPFPMRILYDGPDDVPKDPWYRELVGGISNVPKTELPSDVGAAVDMVTFMINTVVYLAWLQNELIRADITLKRRVYTHISTLFNEFPQATAFFNCTGLGARHLGGVEDQLVYPTKGQTILVAEPHKPLERMYIKTSAKWGNEFAHVFPRPLGGGIIIGGTRRDNDWTSEPDLQLAERIKERCCALAPELGKTEDLQVISHNVGLRPSRTGGARVELERKGGRVLVHNYGAGGAGYQSSWGMAAHAIELFQQHLASKARL